MITRRGFAASLAGLAAAPLAVAALGLPAATQAAGVPKASDTAGAFAGITGIDTHAHIFEVGMKLADVRRYAPDYNAKLADYLAVLDQHGMSHGVLVQPSFLGTDNSYMAEALKAEPKRLRAVGVIDPSDLGKIDELNAIGVVGARLNLYSLPDPDLTSPDWQAAIARMRDHGWHMEFHAEPERTARLMQPVLKAGVKVVVDHFGRPNAKLGIDDPGFRAILKAGSTGLVWVKISGFYRNGADGRGEEVALAAMPLLRDAIGVERLLWGSDWPHTSFEKTLSYPSSHAMLEKLLPDARDRHTVLVEVPARLFRFV
ncbi:amidohydrolase family protein [Azospirillum sp. sgz302134]